MHSAFRILLRGILGIWVVMHTAAQAAQAAPESITTLDQGQAWITVVGRSERSLLSLPYRWDAFNSAQNGLLEMEIPFELEGEPAEPHALFLPRMGNGYEVWLNGVLLSRAGRWAIERDLNSAFTQGNSGSDFAKMPRYLAVPPTLLQKNNLLRIRLQADAGRSAGLAPIQIGSEHSVRSAYEALHSLRTGLIWATLSLLMIATMVCAAVWLTQPQREVLYATAGLSALLWALCLLDTVIENTWLPWPQWGYLQTGFNVCAWLATLTFCSTAWRSQQASLRKIAALMLLVLVYVMWQVWLERYDDSLAYRPGIAIGLSVYAGLVLAIVIRRFRAASVQARELLYSLESRVAEREAQLNASYQKLETLAREQERSQERSRILRNMHDGVGAHISAAMRQVQTGQAGKEEVLATLRDSLDQLKLSIDAIHLQPGDVGMLLANMRYRLQPRFESSGIHWDWQVQSLPVLARLDHSAMQQLQFILFEIFSNVLQHSGASLVTLQGSEQADGVQLIVIDNGHGFDTQVTQSRGLMSMRSRAQAIGAELTITSNPSQTRVQIKLPFELSGQPDSASEQSGA